MFTQHLSYNWIFIANTATEWVRRQWKNGTRRKWQKYSHNCCDLYFFCVCARAKVALTFTSYELWYNNGSCYHFLSSRSDRIILHLNSLIHVLHYFFSIAICRLKLAPITITRATYKFKNQFKISIICISSVIQSIGSIVHSFVRLVIRSNSNCCLSLFSF